MRLRVCGQWPYHEHDVDLTFFRGKPSTLKRTGNRWFFSVPSRTFWDKNVNFTVLQALRLFTVRTTRRGSRGIALLFLDHGTRRGECSASRPGRYLRQGKTRYPLYRRLGGSQGRSGQVRKISPPPGFDPRTVQPVAILTTLPGPLEWDWG